MIKPRTLLVVLLTAVSILLYEGIILYAAVWAAWTIGLVWLVLAAYGVWLDHQRRRAHRTPRHGIYGVRAKTYTPHPSYPRVHMVVIPNEDKSPQTR